MENNDYLKNNWDLIVVLILYSLLSVVYIILEEMNFHYQLAHEYAVGKWGDAINGYWSPLYSGLMTPFLLLGSTPLYALYVSKLYLFNHRILYYN
jgi:hypothetical protein